MYLLNDSLIFDVSGLFLAVTDDGAHFAFTQTDVVEQGPVGGTGVAAGATLDTVHNAFGFGTFPQLLF